MLRVEMKYVLKEEVRKEIDYFRRWVRKSKNLKIKKKLLKHYIKLLENKKNWIYIKK